jgi:glyoxylase-like metal-dependent hydrolase (beta-lactamase superfamily II)
MTNELLASRRGFLQSAGAFAAGAILLRYAPSALLAQANTADAMRAQIGGAPIETTRLGERLVMLSGPGGNVVVSHGNFKVVVDGFVQPAWPRLKTVLDGLDTSPIKSIVDTHWHFDHADNNANFRKAGAGIIAHENTKTRLLEPHDLLGMHFDPSPTAALPTQTFPTGLTLNANGEQIEIRHLAPAHTDTDVTVFFPKANVLHMGDVFFNGRYPFIDASTGGHINGMIAGVEAGLKIANAQTKIVPGHGALAQRPSLEAFGLMLTDVRDRVLKLKAAGKSLAEVQAAKPSATHDGAWGKGGMPADDFVALVYNTLG